MIICLGLSYFVILVGLILAVAWLMSIFVVDEEGMLVRFRETCRTLCSLIGGILLLLEIGHSLILS